MTMTCSDALIEVVRDMEAGREIKPYRIQLIASLVQNLEDERDRLNRELANAQTDAEQAEADASARRQMAAIMADCRPENVVLFPGGRNA